MRLHRTLRPIWLLPILLAGCSSTGGWKLGGAGTTPRPNAIAVVGDHALPASTGESGGKVVADAEEPEPRRNPETRISGRVVDEAGDPVPGATVRLADGGVRGGKEIVGRADRSGAFTLNGLRPGSSYVLIAEGEDERGPILGRVEARTAQTGVKIALGPDDKKPTTRRAAKPPRAKPISNREDIEEGPDPEEAPRVNREDVAEPAHPADSIDPGPPEPARGGRPRLSAPEPGGIGWRNTKDATASRPKKGDDEESPTASPDSPARKRRVPRPAVPADSDEGENPLPPAIDPDGADSPVDRGPSRPASARSNRGGQVGTKDAPKPREAGEIAMAPRPGHDARAEEAMSLPKLEAGPALAGEVKSLSTLMPDFEPSTSSPPTMPPVAAEPVKLAANEAPSPTPSPPDPAAANHDVPPSKPAPQPVFASNPPASKPVETPSTPAEYNPFANLPTAAPAPPRVVAKAPIVSPTAAEIEPTAATEPPKKKWGELVAVDRPVAVVPPAKATLASSIFRRIRPPAEAKEPSVAACSYDPRLRKLNDFRLPDLEGKPVRFQELDADFVLLDFWGTWCAPCLDSIPHLVGLQKKYGPGKLKVVGIACEQSAPETRKAKVDEVSRKLGINYPVLLSTMDGKPCPVQEAFMIQAMPTLILIDRKGEVLWRISGSTPENESRLDKVLALAMSRGQAARR